MSRKTRPLVVTDANNREIHDSDSWTTFRGDYTGTNLIYAGFARVGASTADPVWQLRKMTYDGSNNLTDITYPENASGNPTFDFEYIWDNRAALTFS